MPPQNKKKRVPQDSKYTMNAIYTKNLYRERQPRISQNRQKPKYILMEDQIFALWSHKIMIYGLIVQKEKKYHV